MRSPAWQQDPPAWATPRVRRTRGLVVALTVLIPLVAVLGIVQNALAPTDVTYADGTVNADRNGWPALSIPLGIATAVVALVWVFRVVSNARAVGDPSRPSPGWAVGSWFIPLAHVVLPFFPLREAWRKSRAGSTGLLAAWWACWGLHLALIYVIAVWSMVVGFAAGADARPGEALVVELPASLQVVGWVDVTLSTAAAALFVAVAWRFERAQAAMAHHLARQHGARPAPS